MSVAVIDVETFSAADLEDCGVDAYAENPSTGVWVLSWCIDDDPIERWHPDYPGDGIPYRLLEHIRLGRTVVAHGAYFDTTIWNEVICRRYEPAWPKIKPEQVVCLMARANALQLPSSLEQCAMTLGLPVQKDMEGRRLMLQMAKPREITSDGEFIWWNIPEKRDRLDAYCDRDVEAERLELKKMLPLSPVEQRVWLVDFRVNKRGMRFDMNAVTRMSRIVDVEIASANEELRAITEQFVPKVTNTQKLAEWIRQQGLRCESVDKESVEEMLEKLDPDRYPHVIRALELRQEAGKSSVAKLLEIPLAINRDHRARGMYRYGGASCTLRWSGWRVQPQNLPRIEDFSQAEINEILNIVLRNSAADAAQIIKYAYGSVVDALSQCLRATIIPGPGNELIGGDFSQVEARILPWLSGEEWVLEAFRKYDVGEGPDIYKLTYANAYRMLVELVSANQRQTGKPMRLSLGYGGGYPAFKGMCKSYKIKVVEFSDDPNVLTRAKVEEIKDNFRDSNPKTVQFWADLEDTAIRAITDSTGKVYTVPNGSISYRKVGPYLFCRLPSGRCLSYVKPRYEWREKVWPDGEKSWQKTIVYYGQDSQTKRFGDQETYGGAFSAHVTQATAREVMAHAMLRLEDNGYPIILHSHDEPVAETKIGRADPDEYRQIMLERLDWMGDLPIAVGKPWVGQRYQKG